MTTPDTQDAWLDGLLHARSRADVADDGFTTQVMRRLAREQALKLAERAWAQLHAAREREAHRARWTLSGMGVGLAVAAGLAARADLSGLWSSTPVDVAAAAVLAVVFAGALLAQCLTREA